MKFNQYNKMWNTSESKWPITLIFIVLLPLAHGQAYHFVIGHRQRNFDHLYREPNTRTQAAVKNFTDISSTADLENSNSTVIVTTVEDSNDLSQTAMDIITIVWYVATFLALAAFFLLMACSDRRCTDAQRNATANETPIPPPTPSPSYSEFAPPSYDSVMKMQRARKSSIFVVPFSIDQNLAKDPNNSPATNNVNSSTTSPSINFYTINELQKLAS